MRHPLSIFFLLLLFSCSKGREESAHSLVREIQAGSPELAVSMAAEAGLSCANAESCPANVGLLLATTGSSVLSCTSFLVAEDLLVTNSHCLPSAVKLLPDLCPERIQLVLPAAGGHAEERFSCKELLGASERPNAVSPDLALIRLEKTGREPFVVSRAGLAPGLHLAYKINPGSGASGTLITQECIPAPDSYRFPLFRLPRDPVFVVGDCPSEAGNSGAPLVNSRGEAVGAFQAALPLSPLQRQAWEPHLLPGEEFAPLALGTNLACLGEGGWSWDGACAPIDDETIQRPRISDFMPALRPTMEELGASLSKVSFHWELEPVRVRTLEREDSFRPSCFIELPAAQALSLELPLIQSRILFNRYMQLTAESRRTGSRQQTFFLQPLANGSLSVMPEGESARELSPCSAPVEQAPPRQL
jgi:hypothetical protein